MLALDLLFHLSVHVPQQFKHYFGHIIKGKHQLWNINCSVTCDLLKEHSINDHFFVRSVYIQIALPAMSSSSAAAAADVLGRGAGLANASLGGRNPAGQKVFAYMQSKWCTMRTTVRTVRAYEHEDSIVIFLI